MLKHGKIVKFDVPPTGCTIDQLRAALRVAGLGEDKARDMLPRNAWSRACKSLKEGRIISQTREDSDYLYFQFTNEALCGDRLLYNFEATMRLHKVTGDVWSAQDLALAAKAKELIDKQIPMRTKADITRLIHKIFRERKGHLVSWDGGGSYFVFGEDESIAESVNVMLTCIGGSMSSLKIILDDSDQSTMQSISKVMRDHMLGMVQDFRESCAKLTAETDQDAVDRRAKAVAALKDEVDFYADALKDYADVVRAEIEQANREMLAKISGVEPVVPRNQRSGSSSPFDRLEQLLKQFESK